MNQLTNTQKGLLTLLALACIAFPPLLGVALAVLIIGFAVSDRKPISKPLSHDELMDLLHNPDKLNKPEPKPYVTPDTKPSHTVEELDEELFPEPIFTGDIYMSADDKSAYLRSTAWRDLKQQRLAIAGGRCEQSECSNSTNLDLHHVTYQRLGAEDISDLRVVCRKCHSNIHKLLGYSRENSYPVL